MLPEPLGAEGIGLSERNGRIFYPAIDSPAFGKLMKELLDSNTPLTTGGPVREEVGGLLRGIFDRPPRTTVYFLFRGSEPLQVTLQLRKPVELTIIPTPQAAAPRRRPRLLRGGPTEHRRLLELWWTAVCQGAGLLQPKPDYPPLVDNYLTATLARRLNLPLPEAKQTPSAESELRKEIGFNLGTESLRMAMMQDRILGLNNLDEPADQPLPEPFNPPELQMPEPAADVKIEPIAMRVPAECFYVRFGSFANFLWLQDTLAKWGGDAQNLDRPARPRPRHEPPYRKATRAEADRALADAGRHGHRRRGHHRNRHVLPRRGLLWDSLPRQEQYRPFRPA